MICYFIILLLTGGYSTLFWYLSDNLPLLPVWILLGFLSALITFALYILFVIFISPFSKPTSKFKQKLIHPLVVFVNSLLRIKIKVIGKNNIPHETHVVYGNHKSMLDITILYQVYDEIISAIAKQSLLKVPFLRRLMKALAVVPIDRDNDREGVKNLLKAIDNVKGGINYIIFPEGGVKSRETERLVALRAGAYKLATKPKATISPISIIGTSKLSKNCPKKKTNVTIVIHKPIQYEEYKDYNTTELGLRVGTIINEGLVTKTPNTKTLDQIEIEDFLQGEEND